MNADETERLAWEIAQFMFDVDPYGFRDNFDCMEEAVDETRALLSGRLGIGRETIPGTLRGLIDDGVLMPEDEARAVELMGRVIALDGIVSMNHKPGYGPRRRCHYPILKSKKSQNVTRISKSRFTANDKTAKKYVAVFQEPEGISFTVEGDLDTIENVIFPLAVKQKPDAIFLEIIPVEQRDFIIQECKKKGYKVG